jgi:hypothetical protein
VRCVLDKCSDVGEAVDILATTSFSTTNNYLMADQTGALAVVEASPDKVKVRRPGDERWIVATNHFILPKMATIENIHLRPPDSKMRYDAIWGFLQNHGGKVDVGAAEEVLADHSGKVCSHVDKIKMGTLWSVVANLTDMTVFRAEGHPVQHIMKRTSGSGHHLPRKDAQMSHRYLVGRFLAASDLRYSARLPEIGLLVELAGFLLGDSGEGLGSDYVCLSEEEIHDRLDVWSLDDHDVVISPQRVKVAENLQPFLRELCL